MDRGSQHQAPCVADATRCHAHPQALASRGARVRPRLHARWLGFACVQPRQCSDGDEDAGGDDQEHGGNLPARAESCPVAPASGDVLVDALESHVRASNAVDQAPHSRRSASTDDRADVGSISPALTDRRVVVVSSGRIDFASGRRGHRTHDECRRTGGRRGTPSRLNASAIANRRSLATRSGSAASMSIHTSSVHACGDFATTAGNVAIVTRGWSCATPRRRRRACRARSGAVPTTKRSRTTVGDSASAPSRAEGSRASHTARQPNAKSTPTRNDHHTASRVHPPASAQVSACAGKRRRRARASRRRALRRRRAEGATGRPRCTSSCTAAGARTR